MGWVRMTVRAGRVRVAARAERRGGRKHRELCLDGKSELHSSPRAKRRNIIVDARDEEHGVEYRRGCGHDAPRDSHSINANPAPQRLKARRPHHRNSNPHLHARHECCPHPRLQPRASAPLCAKTRPTLSRPCLIALHGRARPCGTLCSYTRLLLIRVVTHHSRSSSCLYC
ncbi:hypothetical protein B0H14DRAFT_2955335 [Mycena olivaceomarginata]|nr:hypothetical protein B0H14DRAFT_2955335 [Mycena olivaceomarginata]